MHLTQKKRWILVGFLLACCVAIHFFSADNQRVESLYATSFYPVLAKILRLSLSWMPFSFGDILYGSLFFYALLKLFQFVKLIFNREKRLVAKQNWERHTTSMLIKFAFIYIVFNLLWGINYNRIGIAEQLNLDIKKYSMEDLKNINAVLITKINSCKQSLVNQNFVYPSSKEMFAKTKEAYDTVSKKYSFLNYEHAAIKKSMWGWLGNYTGFLGYYNPFTGEAQINTTVPKFTQPFTTCHEVAHQLGYAKEMEANFVGYLAASNSTDTSFKYAVYADLFSYANRTLFIADSTASLFYRKQLSASVIKDFKERRKFNEEHISFIEPIVRYIYGIFLQQNQQPMGILSYDEVTSFIIAYYKKYNYI
jgi:hypothetical protein